jgi:hypothetical protein
MEILIMVLIAGGIGYWMYKNVSTKPADKSENTGITAVGEPPATVAVEGAGAVSWHTAPPAGSALAQNTLDVNHDGKVDLQDVKEVVKKVRGKKAAEEKKPAAMKAPAKKTTAKKATGEKKPRAPRKPKASS